MEVATQWYNGHATTRVQVCTRSFETWLNFVFLHCATFSLLMMLRATRRMCFLLNVVLLLTSLSWWWWLSPYSHATGSPNADCTGRQTRPHWSHVLNWIWIWFETTSRSGLIPSWKNGICAVDATWNQICSRDDSVRTKIQFETTVWTRLKIRLDYHKWKKKTVVQNWCNLHISQSTDCQSIEGHCCVGCRE